MAQDNFLDLSDDEVANMSTPPVSRVDTSTHDTVVEDAIDDTVDSNETDTDDGEDTSDNDSDSDSGDEDSNESSTDTEGKDSNGDDDNGDSNTNSDKSEPTQTIDYKAEYEKLVAPFRANNKDMSVANVDDAITLMKMGANYNKKMAGLKPALRLVKMLENNGLFNEAKLSHLIDLDKKNPAAIGKLLTDSGIDPLEVDVEGSKNYKPQTYTVDDTEVELDAVLDDIRDTPAFSETIDIISNKWDTSSKQVLLKNPSIISVINEHVSLGIYAQITKVIENERVLGRLSHLSDIEAYKQVGDAMQANGMFGSNPTAKPATIVPPTNTKAAIDPLLVQRKKAAGSTRSTVSTESKSEYNPLSMSDAEFEKIANSKYR